MVDIAFKNERISNFERLVTLTLDRVILHSVVQHSSTSTYTPNDNIQCAIGYIRLGPFVDIKKSGIKRYCLINLVEFILCLRVPSLLPLITNMFVDNRFENCKWDRNSKDRFITGPPTYTCVGWPD